MKKYEEKYRKGSLWCCEVQQENSNQQSESGSSWFTWKGWWHLHIISLSTQILTLGLWLWAHMLWVAPSSQLLCLSLPRVPSLECSQQPGQWLKGHWTLRSTGSTGTATSAGKWVSTAGILVAGDMGPTMAHGVLLRLFFNILELHLKSIRLVWHHLSPLQLHCILSHYSSECSPKLCIALKSQLSAFVCLDL